MNTDTIHTEPYCVVYHNGKRVWPAEAAEEVHTIYPSIQPPAPPPRLNRHERRRAKKLARA